MRRCNRSLARRPGPLDDGPRASQGETRAGTGALMAFRTISKLGYVVLHCRDLKASRRFYHHVMGFPIAQERADWIQFQVGDTGLVLRPLDQKRCDLHPEPHAVQIGIRVRYDEIHAFNSS